MVSRSNSGVCIDERSIELLVMRFGQLALYAATFAVTVLLIHISTIASPEV